MRMEINQKEMNENINLKEKNISENTISKRKINYNHGFINQVRINK